MSIVAAPLRPPRDVLKQNKAHIRIWGSTREDENSAHINFWGKMSIVMLKTTFLESHAMVMRWPCDGFLAR